MHGFRFKADLLRSATVTEGGGAPALAGNPAPAPAGGNPAPGADAPAGEPWYVQRIGVLTAQRSDANAKLTAAETARAAAEAKAAELQQRLDAAARVAGAAGGPAGNPAPAGGPTPVGGPAGGRTYTEEELSVAATAKAQELAFNERCNALALEGRQAFKDFDTKISGFKQIGGLPTSMLEATLELPEGHKVLYALSEDLNETTRIMGLATPARQATALALFAQKMGQGQGTAAAAPAGQGRQPPPAPPASRVDRTGARGDGTVDLYSDNVSSSDWFAARIAQKKAAREAGRRR